MDFKFLIVAVLLCVTSTVQAQDAVTGVPFDADYFAGGSADKPGVIVLTGSGGGKANDTAQSIADMGYNVLSLAYFDRGGSQYVPETLELIPLEYFDAPKKWLAARSSSVILYGLSKGAELALVLASYDPDYKAVVALAPSKVVWQGNPKDFSKIMDAPSSWSKDGEGLAFVPYISRDAQKALGLDNRHAASLTNEDAVDKARIKIENIKVPMLLLSGGEDQSWPSTEMANDICARALSNCEHVSYSQGDHLLTNFSVTAFAEVAKFLKQIN
ncbi:MAG: dienelactone hydrolase [Kordiimonadaceae bacterium]|nr:dienelactone hydrolase [Kordiimonadaceae bacterium]MBT6037525.1 dienelactone hydrolase [Kordiimonadaceae bacterium]MBT6330273.1 dienelactone hydrolase [Kordiimonadaceae bacterium]MBT7582695.1 dienelactone hydrolase [Kordiimonadaceae bacterium]